MKNCCARPVVKYPQGNDVLLKVRYYQGEGQSRSEFTLDVYDDWNVALLRDGVIKTATTCQLDDENHVILYCPASLGVGRYSVVTTMSSNGMKRKSVLCGLIEIVECDADSNITGGVYTFDDMAEIDVSFELVATTWTQGLNQYEIWKMNGHEDATLQEYLDIISSNIDQETIDRINGDIRSLQLAVEQLANGKLGYEIVNELPNPQASSSRDTLFLVPVEDTNYLQGFISDGT